MPKKYQFRSSPPEVLLGKSLLKRCSKFTGEHLCRSVISIELLFNFIEITLRHGCPPVNLLHISRTPFYKNTSGGPFLPILLALTWELVLIVRWYLHHWIVIKWKEGYWLILLWWSALTSIEWLVFYHK